MTDWNPWRPSEWSVTVGAVSDPSLPKVSLGVLNYNRCAALRQTLDVLTAAIQYPEYEVIVVDNGSTDGSIQMVRAEYPSVILFEVGKNEGVSSRNYQAQVASGKYLFSFDDDTFPATPATVLRMVQHLEAHSEIDALCGQYYQPVNGFNEMQGWHRNDSRASLGLPCLSPPEGGLCFRLSSLRKTAGYDERLIYGCEGWDLALQFLKQDLTIYYAPWFATLHFAYLNRVHERRIYLQSRHTIWLFAKHWQRPLLPLLYLLWIARRIVGVLTHPKFAKATFKSFWDGFRGIDSFLKDSPKLTWSQSLSLRRFYQQLFRW